jgi:HEAT repeats
MPFGRGRGRYAQIDDVILRARAFPSGDYRRWQVIAELATAEFTAAFERAAALLRTSDPASMTLGAEIFDELFIGMREGRRLVREAEQILLEVCRPRQHPEVLAAALNPYAQVSPDPQPLLLEFLDHPDARVRRAAAQLVASGGGEFADDRQVDTLIALLDRDPDPGVREQAADGLELILTCYPYVAQRPQITAALTGRLDDPNPVIRASALVGAGVLDIDAAVRRLVAELAAARPAWQFVDAFNRLAQIEDCGAELRADAHRELLRLKQQGWPQDADPARFPNASERSDLLEKALDATSAGRRPAPAGRRQAFRLRR